jgi:hypothetical protein
MCTEFKKRIDWLHYTIYYNKLCHIEFLEKNNKKDILLNYAENEV